jgi:hypothetical protein
MGLPNWLATVLHMAPAVLAFTPLAPLAPFVAAGVHAAEQIPGATGAQKLNAAVNIAQAGILAAQAAGVTVDAQVTNQAIVDGVNAVVAGVNSFHGKGSAPAAPPA